MELMRETRINKSMDPIPKKGISKVMLLDGSVHRGFDHPKMSNAKC